jgi:hypothetical protein
MNRHRGFSRAVILSAATIVATLTVATVAHAVQVITTPNASSIRYSLAPGTNSIAERPPGRRSAMTKVRWWPAAAILGLWLLWPTGPRGAR